MKPGLFIFLLFFGAVNCIPMTLYETRCLDHIPSMTNELLQPEQCLLVEYPQNTGPGDFLLLLKGGVGDLGADKKTKVALTSAKDGLKQLTLKNSVNGVEQILNNIKLGETFEVHDDVVSDDAKTMTVENAKENYNWAKYFGEKDLDLIERAAIDPKCSDMELFRVSLFCHYVIGPDPANYCNLGNKKFIQTICKGTCSRHSGSCADTRWSYEGFLGQDNWAKNLKMANNKCDGRKQSPINLTKSNNTKNVTVQSSPLQLGSAYTNDKLSGKLVNDGHTAKLEPGSTSPSFTLTFGGVVYSLLQIHFHWGNRSTAGSEHTENGNSFPLEMHIVHKNDSNKLLVLGLLFDLGSSVDSVVLKPFIDKIPDIIEPKSETQMTDINLKPFFDKVSSNNFYSYSGSLTTPVCSEIVQWIVFAEKLKVSANQLEELRKMKDIFGDKVTANYRNVQPLNGRNLTRYQPK